jgi:hypothetical protein
MRRWIWRKFEFDLPEDWEMLQFSRNPASGKCAFADRNQFRLELNWRHVPAVPDFDRMISDYMNKLAEQGMSDGRRVSAGQWAGLEGRVAAGIISRFGWYSGRESCVVETVFLWPAERDKGLEEKILSSFRDSLPDDRGRIRWRAFGMDVSVPEGWQLDRCRMEPAYAKMTFKDSINRRGEVSFARRGMVEEWLKEPLAKWLKASAGEMLEATQDPTEVSTGAHRRLSIRGVHRMPGLFGRKMPGFAQGWICPHDGRLYSMVACGKLDGANELKLECCDGR